MRILACWWRWLPLLALASCVTTPEITDPLATLQAPDAGPRAQVAAMTMLDTAAGDPAEYEASLNRVVWRAGYTLESRQAAIDRLLARDPEGLKKTIRQRLALMNAWDGRRRLCEVVAEQGWVDLTPALVSSWAEPVIFVDDERERPEFIALSQLHPDRRVADVVFDCLLEDRRVAAQGLRTRAWTLLHRLGERERLVELVTTVAPAPDDSFLLDLHIGARELGIVPHNREEILWMRKLREPSRAAFWTEAASAMTRLPSSRRQSLELRDLPVVVAAARHAPELLDRSVAELYDTLARRLEDATHYAHSSAFDNTDPRRRERLHEWRSTLTWGDLVAMLIIKRGLDVPEVVEHLFDYADRDREDETTEYGGVISLDRRGRFEVLEFPPRVRHHDEKFIASQAMMDAGYTALFHFHLHVQRPSNRQYAGPGFGDVTYADNTRANCLVFTSVKAGHLNVDFYRHGRVIVDLGTVARGVGERNAG